jgi:hypothetical protein
MTAAEAVLSQHPAWHFSPATERDAVRRIGKCEPVVFKTNA